MSAHPSDGARASPGVQQRALLWPQAPQPDIVRALQKVGGGRRTSWAPALQRPGGRMRGVGCEMGPPSGRCRAQRACRPPAASSPHAPAPGHRCCIGRMSFTWNTRWRRCRTQSCACSARCPRFAMPGRGQHGSWGELAARGPSDRTCAAWGSTALQLSSRPDLHRSPPPPRAQRVPPGRLVPVLPADHWRGAADAGRGVLRHTAAGGQATLRCARPARGCGGRRRRSARRAGGPGPVLAGCGGWRGGL